MKAPKERERKRNKGQAAQTRRATGTVYDKNS